MPLGLRDAVLINDISEPALVRRDSRPLVRRCAGDDDGNATVGEPEETDIELS
jgi:hypothetical protein